MKKNLFKIFYVAFILTIPGCKRADNSTVVPAQTYPAVFSYEKTAGGLPYRLLMPGTYDQTRSYPLVIMLHGAGQRGVDNEKNLDIGSTLFLRDSIRSTYPALVVFPQTPSDQSWETPGASARLEELLTELKDTWRIDKARIYLGGISDGAGGVYALVPRNPDVFAAAFAIAGHGDVTKASSMKVPSWWIFHGDQDQTNSPRRSEEMVRALKEVGASVKFTLYPGVGHPSWEQALSEPGLCQWLFSKRK